MAGSEENSSPHQGGSVAVSSREIARLAGVSQATISRVLAGNPHVAPETRARVLRVAEEAGYVPNLAARSLVTNRSAIVGLVVSNITNPFYPELIEAVCSEAAHHGLGVILCSTQDDASRQQEALSLLLQHRVDGLIVTSVMLESPDVESILKRGVPMVLVNRYLKGSDCTAVLTDNRGGAIKAVEHLAELGHRRIGFVQGICETSTSWDRQRGYCWAVKTLGLEADESLVVPGNFTAAGASAATDRLLALDHPPTAVVCADDETALGVLDRLTECGKRVPEDVALVGFDDIRIAGHSAIGLTTVRQPTAMMAKLAMEKLIERIETPEVVSAERIVIPSELVIRSSSDNGVKPPAPP